MFEDMVALKNQRVLVGFRGSVRADVANQGVALAIVTKGAIATMNTAPDWPMFGQNLNDTGATGVR